MGIHTRAGEAINQTFPPLLKLWDMILVDIHYGLGVGGALSHIVLGIVSLWVVASGLVIFMRVRARQKKL